LALDTSFAREKNEKERKAQTLIIYDLRNYTKYVNKKNHLCSRVPTEKQQKKTNYTTKPLA